MATKKSSPKKSTPQNSKLLKAAEKVGTIAGTIVGKKNQLIKKAERVIETTKAKVHELTAKKAEVKQSAKTAARATVKKAANKVSEVKQAAKTAAKSTVKKASDKANQVKQVATKAAVKARNKY